MSLSMHQIAANSFVKVLTNVSAILDKAAASCEARKIDPAVLINARLAPDMFPLSRQIQIMSDAAKGCMARLAGVENPSFPDTETTFADLQARIAKTIDFVKSITPEQLVDSEAKSITLPLRGDGVTFTGQSLLLHFSLPNVYFHATTAYAILRHNGVDLGKMDFLGAL